MKTSDLSEFDLYLFHQGTNFHAYEMLGAHFAEQDGKKGVRFAVWAPHAKSVSVVGDFNDWTPGVHTLVRRANGTRSVRVALPSGSAFRFRYLGEGGDWFDDELKNEVERRVRRSGICPAGLAHRRGPHAERAATVAGAALVGLHRRSEPHTPVAPQHGRPQVPGEQVESLLRLLCRREPAAGACPGPRHLREDRDHDPRQHHGDRARHEQFHQREAAARSAPDCRVPPHRLIAV